VSHKLGIVSRAFTVTPSCIIHCDSNFVFAVGDDVKEQVGVKVSIKELDDVLMRDVGGKIVESGRYRSCLGHRCRGGSHAWDLIFN
jgi:hypothetical protein